MTLFDCPVRNSCSIHRSHRPQCSSPCQLAAAVTCAAERCCVAMPQTFVALQCAFCNTFQGQLDKKSKKFTCVICNAKQSFRTIFAVSNSGKDIRMTVQQLNEFRGAQDELKGSEQAQQLQQQLLQQQQTNKPAAIATVSTHTWQDFAAEGADGPEDDVAGDESGFVTAVPDVQLGKRRQRMAAAGSGGTQQTHSKRSKQQQQGDESSGAGLPGRMQQHSTAPGRTGQNGQPHAAAVSHPGQPVPQWQQPSGGAQSSRRGPPAHQPLQWLPQQGQHANQPHFQQQQQERGKAGISNGSWQGSQGNQNNTAQQQWSTQQQQQRQHQQGSSVPWPPQQHQQGIAAAGAQAGAPPNQANALSGPGQHSSNQQQPGQQAQKQPGSQASWQQEQQQQGQTWLPKQQQMQQEWQPQGQQQWQAKQQRQQQAWQQPLGQTRPAQEQLTCHGRLPGAARQGGSNRPPHPPQRAAAAKGGRPPVPAAANAWSAFVDDADQAAGEGSDDDDGGMCFVTDADVAAQWT